MKIVIKRFISMLLLLTVLISSVKTNVYAATNYFYPDDDFYFWASDFMLQSNLFRTTEQIYTYFVNYGIPESQANTMARMAVNNMDLTYNNPGGASFLYQQVMQSWPSMNLTEKVNLVDLYIQTTGKGGAGSGSTDTRVPIPDGSSQITDGDGKYSIPKDNIDSILKYFDDYFKNNISYGTGDMLKSVGGMYAQDFLNSVLAPLGAKADQNTSYFSSFMSAVSSRPFVTILKSIQKVSDKSQPLGYYYNHRMYFKLESSGFYSPSANILNCDMTSSVTGQSYHGDYYFIDREVNPMGNADHRVSFGGSAISTSFRGQLLGVDYMYIVPNQPNIPEQSIENIINNIFDGGGNTHQTTNNDYYYQYNPNYTDNDYLNNTDWLNEILKMITGNKDGDVYNITINNYYETTDPDDPNATEDPNKPENPGLTPDYEYFDEKFESVENSINVHSESILDYLKYNVQNRIEDALNNAVKQIEVTVNSTVERITTPINKKIDELKTTLFSFVGLPEDAETSGTGGKNLAEMFVDALLASVLPAPSEDDGESWDEYFSKKIDGLKTKLTERVGLDRFEEAMKQLEGLEETSFSSYAPGGGVGSIKEPGAMSIPVSASGGIASYSSGSSAGSIAQSAVGTFKLDFTYVDMFIQEYRPVINGFLDFLLVLFIYKQVILLIRRVMPIPTK